MNISRSYRAVAAGATALLGSALLVAAGPAGSAVALDFCSPTVYNGFADTSTLVLNGDAAIVSTTDGTVLRVSPADYYHRGSAYSPTTVDLANDGSFRSAFSFRYTNQLGGGADGIVFTLQKSSTALGAVGGGIGYQNSGNPSLGIEFDNWLNTAAYGDTNANHAAINLNGNLASPLAYKSLADAGITLDAAQRTYAWVDYNGVTDLLEVRVSATSTRPADPFMTATVDLEGMGTAYMGFTSATGSAAANHDIIDWSFSDAEYQAGAFLPPINNDGSSVFKIGSTIPVKIAITCGGVPVDTLTPTVQLDQASGIPDGAVNEAVITEVPTNGKVMQWMADDGFYKYNLSTKNSEFNDGQPLEPGTYRLSVVDPSLAAPASVMISLR